ncbi:MAG: AAA family ATPase [Acidobacteria bacterium]|nr:AAA family ATPase [Acidobacteriota bacterium]
MTLLPWPLPSPPHWHVDWQALQQFDWIAAMKHCPQDPVHHAEGDVWTHVRLVCESLASLAVWRSLPEPQRELLFVAALLHDVAKPVCSRHEDGRITSRGHSQRGAVMARRILWEHDVDPLLREHICSLVRYHQLPFYLIERADALRSLLRISQSTPCGLLAILAKADALGRTCRDREGLLTRIALFEEMAREQSCLSGPWPFPSPLSRFEYFRRDDRDPRYKAHDSSRCEVILMCGLPGSGKDTWLREHVAGLPLISLDEMREEVGVDPGEAPGELLQTARERARVLLRTASSFAWNATNLTRDLRAGLVDLFTSYHARVHIVHIEAPRHALLSRNDARERPLPPRVIERMLGRWDVPDATEAPIVEWWENDRAFVRRSPPASSEVQP